MGLPTNYSGAPQKVTSNGLRRLDGPTKYIPKNVASRSCRKTISFFSPFTNVKEKVHLPIREIYLSKKPICSIAFFRQTALPDTGRKAVKILGSFAILFSFDHLKLPQNRHGKYESIFNDAHYSHICETKVVLYGTTRH